MALIDILINGLMQGSFYALFAVSFAIVFGVMDIPNLAHAAFYALAGYLFFQIFTLSNLHWVIALLGAIIIVVLVGVVVERTFFRPLYEREHSEYTFGVILVTLGLAQISERAFGQIWGREPKFIEIKGIEQEAFTVLGSSVSYTEVLMITITGGSFLFLYWFIYHTMTGHSLRAIVEDRELAYMKGVNVDRVFQLSFMVGSVLIAIAGVFNAVIFTVTPSAGFDLLIKSFIIVILGGIGNVLTAGVAGLMLGLYEAFAVSYFSSVLIFASEFAVLIVYFLVKGSLAGRERISIGEMFQRIRSANK